MYMFTEALKAALPHIARKDSNPLLTHALVCDGMIYATDRYTAIRVPFVEEGITSSFLLRRVDAIELSRQKGGLVGYQRGPAQDAHVFTFDSGASLTFHAQPEASSGYPTVSRLFDLFKPEAAETFDVSPAYMERFAPKHIGRGVALRITSGAYRKPFSVVGWAGEERFTALVQPLKSALDN